MTIFTYGCPPLRIGPGASDGIGPELAAYGVRRALLLTDGGMANTGIPQRIAQTAAAHGVDIRVWPGVRVEPTDASLRAAVDYASGAGPWGAFVAVGGGSSIDTAKVVNLLTTCEGDLMEYVDAPVGGGRVPDRPLKPLVAVPTTTGSGAESTSSCVLDVLSTHVRATIGHPRLRPSLAVVDPLLTRTLPPQVVASSGMDALLHALEGWTARPYDTVGEPAVSWATTRGSNPLADLWAGTALGLIGRSLRRALDPDDETARADLMLAAVYAGITYGSAGAHLPHAAALPIAGRVRTHRSTGYPQRDALVPHGTAAAVTAPEVFRFTFAASPERHLAAARWLAPDDEAAGDGADRLPAVLAALMRDLGLPRGLGELGYTEGDVPELVAETLAQQALVASCPCDVDADDLAGILTRSMTNW